MANQYNIKNHFLDQASPNFFFVDPLFDVIFYMDLNLKMEPHTRPDQKYFKAGSEKYFMKFIEKLNISQK